MTEPDSSIELEKRQLVEAEAKGAGAALKLYTRLSGPGWLQSAITLGGGSLAGSLYLGVLAGYSLMWLQPVAMIMGIIMLSAISYVTLSTGKRPLQAINDHVNPVLGWGWAVATLMANIVWCLPQFSLGTAAVQQNLLPALSGTGGKVVICFLLFAAATTVIWFYDSGSKGIKVFEVILKTMVGLVVICFFGVVVKMGMSRDGLPWDAILAGFFPDLGLLNHPANTFDWALARTDTFADFWRMEIVSMQRDVMITAAATAVGINMTFLLPYSMLKKNWGREHRGLAVFDLSTGLFIPFVLATSCVVIASASRFHAQPQEGLMEGTAPAGMQAQYMAYLESRVRAEIGADAFADLDETEKASLTSALPMPDKSMAAMLVKRDAFNLAESLQGLTGPAFANYIFGIGVLGMALSTIIILMLISGFTVCEMAGVPPTGLPHRLGCLLAGLGVLGPFIWSGKTQFWLAVPTSVFGMTLLPIAYLTFFLMMNNRGLMGKDIPRGKLRIFVNGLLLIALGVATFGAAWSVWNKVKWIGVAVVCIFFGLAILVHFIRPPKKIEIESGVPDE